jgi:putative FmdB family regulatory protein
MPYYDYLCDECGPFTGFAAMADFDKPAPCPDCSTEARRALLTPPKLAIGGAATRRAHEANERAQHEPKRSGHGSGCTCCSGATKQGGVLHRPDGAKSFPGKRPWMISH